MYNLKVIVSGNRVEIYKINGYIINEGKKAEEFNDIEAILKDDNNSSLSDKDNIETRKETLYKARNNIIRLIKCNSDMNTFITLTFKVEQDYKESKKSLDNLFHRLRRDYEHLKYLWVLEYGDLHKRLHYHLLCNIPVPIKLSDSRHRKTVEHKKYESDFAFKYWPYGFVDIRQLEQENNTNIALYVSTYIVKSLQNVDLKGYRVYGYSRKTLDKPIVTKVFTKDNLETILRQFDCYDVVFSNSYKIGYTDWNGDHKGTVIYLDLKLRGV